MVKNEKLGFIGVGQMGKHMALNLKNAGYDIYAFDIDRTAMGEIQRHGITTCSSCRKVALAVDDTIIIMVRNGKQEENVIFGEEGLTSSGRQDLNLIVTSTIELTYVRRLGEAVANTGYRMLNVPVSGGVHGAQKGILTLIASGDESLYVKSRPIFDAIGEKIFYFGTEQETSQAAKLANNLMLGINIVSCIEGFRFAKSMGISEETFKELVSYCTGDSWAARNWEWTRALWEDIDKWENKSVLNNQYKDMHAVLDEGRVSLPLTALVTELFLSKKNESERTR